MIKIKSALLILAAVMITNIVSAQSIEEGKKFFYYEKYLSAQSVFQKLIQANPNNTDAVYWLGQSMLANDKTQNLQAVKKLYQNALAANSNSALLTAGMGNVELLEGNAQDARNKFETAISLSQGKNIAVLNAVGLANGDYDSKNGDAGYAIEKLKQATTLKGFKDPETWCLLGDAYKKNVDGGNAIQAYQGATALNPKYARAYYRMGKVYQTQGASQSDIFMKYYNDAIAADPNYSPVYYNLYEYYYQTDVNKAGDNLDKYLTLMGDDEPKGCFYRASQKFAQGLNQDVIAKAKECIAASGASPYPKLYGIMGYAYDKLNDSINAKNSFEQYFKIARPDIIGSGDYKKYAEILNKFPGNDSIANTYLVKAIAIDTTESGKAALLKSIGARYESQKRYADAATWYKKVVDLKVNPSRTDIYNAASNFTEAGNYQTAVDEWGVYTAKYPSETYGYYMTGFTQQRLDSTNTKGLAAPSYQKVVDLGEAQWSTDSAKVKNHLLNAYKYLIEYSFNIKKDKKAAIEYCNKYLAKDPTNTEVQGFRKRFEGGLSKPSAASVPAAAPVAKPKTAAIKGTSRK